MRVFHALFATETNTFSPIPTSAASFERAKKRRQLWRRALEPFTARGADIFGAFQAGAEPSGPIVRKAYEALRDELLGQISDALPLDYVVLVLHGAMVADGYDDCEGDLLARIRHLAGASATVGATLDPHCHLTPKMIDTADLLLTYKEYPHFDMADRLNELVAKVIAIHEGRLSPVPSVCRVPVISLYATDREPMRSFVDRLFALEKKNGIISISVAHGFPWGDVPEMGTKVLVYADGGSKGAQLARALATELFDMRGATFPTLTSLNDAVRIAIQQPGLTVMGDLADNPGGGAPGDATFLLHTLVDNGATDVAFGALWDPVAVDFAMLAGVGVRVRLRVGGKASAASGSPLDVEGVVTAIREKFSVPIWDVGVQHYGNAVALRLERGIDLVLTTTRGQVYSPKVFEDIGIDVRSKHIAVVKSAYHFNREFGPIAARVMHVSSPGTLSMDFRTIPYLNIRRPIWPLDEVTAIA
jgi:microcystin degradation protein MlrC